MPQSILVIDNDEKKRTIVCDTLANKLFYQVLMADYASDLEVFLKPKHPNKPDAILLDISKHSHFSYKIEEIKKLNALVPIIVLITYGNYEQGTHAIQSGAFDFLTIPIVVERLKVTLNNAISFRDTKYKNEILHHKQWENNKHIVPLFDAAGEVRTIQQIEKDAIHLALDYYNGSIAQTANRLGMGRTTLYRKINSY